MKKMLFMALLASLIFPVAANSAKKIKEKNPTEVTVTFDSQPRGVLVVVNGKSMGVTPLTATIPVTSVIESSLRTKIAKTNEIEIKFIKEGYTTGVEHLKPNVVQNLNFEEAIS